MKIERQKNVHIEKSFPCFSTTTTRERERVGSINCKARFISL